MALATYNLTSRPRESGGPTYRDLLTVPPFQGPRLRGDDDQDR